MYTYILNFLEARNIHHMRANKHVQHLYKRVYIYTYICMYIRMYLYMYVCMHVCNTTVMRNLYMYVYT
jgi:hypothetical protein